MAHLAPKPERVICCSAGNHAQGVAYSARKLGIRATIVMPKGTPIIKQDNVTRMGGKVELHGADFDAAKEECTRLAQDELINIPPFDDPYVIAGQGTIGFEILQQTCPQKLEAIFCPVGGGGLIAGVGVYVKRIAPHVKIIGVQSDDADAMKRSLDEKKRVKLEKVGLFADGTAVKMVGKETFRICTKVVDDIITVTKNDICAAMDDLFEDTRSIVEPSGALALAGLNKYVDENPSSDQRTLVAVVSGANIDFDRLRYVGATLHEDKECLLTIRIPEERDSFVKLLDAIMPCAITKLSYRYVTDTEATVLIGLSPTAPATERTKILTSLKSNRISYTDLSEDGLAKSYVRYLMGNRSDADKERLYIFNLSERIGTFQKFLGAIRSGDKISHFQYWNEGGDIGKILCGIPCPDGTANPLGYLEEEWDGRSIATEFLDR
jgi:threonine dehydratase